LTYFYIKKTDETISFENFTRNQPYQLALKYRWKWNHRSLCLKLRRRVLRSHKEFCYKTQSCKLIGANHI